MREAFPARLVVLVDPFHRLQKEDGTSVVSPAPNEAALTAGGGGS
jgi:hypothetical protein